MDLDHIAKIAQIASAVIAFIAATFISRQLLYTRRAREADVLLKIISLSDSDRMTGAKEWLVYQSKNYPSALELKADKEALKEFTAVVHLFETMGVLVNNKYIPEDLVFDKYGLLIVGAWDQLNPLISSMQSSGQAREYAENFQLLVSKYNKWAQSNRLKMFEGERTTFDIAKNFLVVGGKGDARVKQKKSSGI